MSQGYTGVQFRHHDAGDASQLFDNDPDDEQNIGLASNGYSPQHILREDIPGAVPTEAYIASLDSDMSIFPIDGPVPIAGANQDWLPYQYLDTPLQIEHHSTTSEMIHGPFNRPHVGVSFHLPSSEQGNSGVSPPVSKNEKAICLNPECGGRSFSRQTDLIRHIETIHYGVRYNCTFLECHNNHGKGYCRPDKVREYHRKHHSDGGLEARPQVSKL